MNALALPAPNEFRTYTMPRYGHARLFAARLVHEYIDYSYSRFDGDHQFVYHVRHHKAVMEIVNDFEARQSRQTPAEAANTTSKMARTLRRAFDNSRI